MAGTASGPVTGEMPRRLLCVRTGCQKECCGAGMFFCGRNALRPGPGQGARRFLCACARAGPKGRCGNALLWQECPSVRPRPRRPALFICVRAGWPERALRCGNVLLWQEYPSARSRPRRPALFICVRAGWPERALRYGNVLLWQECPSARPRPKAAGARYAWARRSGKRQEQFGAGAALRAV